MNNLQQPSSYIDYAKHEQLQADVEAWYQAKEQAQQAIAVRSAPIARPVKQPRIIAKKVRKTTHDDVVFDVIKNNPMCTRFEIAIMTGASRAKTERSLRSLYQSKRIKVKHEHGQAVYCVGKSA